MKLNNIYLKVRRRVRKALLKFLEYSYENEKLDNLEAKLIALGCKTLLSNYLQIGVAIPDKAYENVAKEVVKLIDKVNLRLQRRLKENDE